MDHGPWKMFFHGQWSIVHCPTMETIARYLMLAGIALFLIGGGAYLAAKFGFPLGRLPGDIRIEGENGSFYFPVTSSILVSVILTIVVNLIGRLLRK